MDNALLNMGLKGTYGSKISTLFARFDHAESTEKK